MLKPILFAALTALVLPAAAALADTTTYSLTDQTWNCNKNCGPYGTVTVDEAANDLSATISVTLTQPGYSIYFNQGNPAGYGDAIEFNAPGSLTISNLPSGFEADSSPSSTGYGSFTEGINCYYKNGATKGACYNSSDPDITSLSFTVSSTTALDFTPTDGVLFSVDVTDKSLGVPDPTGDVAALAATPEPSSLMLLGTGILGAAGTLRRRFKA